MMQQKTQAHLATRLRVLPRENALRAIRRTSQIVTLVSARRSAPSHEAELGAIDESTTSNQVERRVDVQTMRFVGRRSWTPRRPLFRFNDLRDPTGRAIS